MITVDKHPWGSTPSCRRPEPPTPHPSPPPQQVGCPHKRDLSSLGLLFGAMGAPPSLDRPPLAPGASPGGLLWAWLGEASQGSPGCPKPQTGLEANKVLCSTVPQGPPGLTEGQGHSHRRACGEAVRPQAFSPNVFLTPTFSLQDWSANPMFERKDNKKEALLDLDGRVVNLNRRYTMVKEAGLKIQAMVAVRTRPRAPSGGHSLLVEEGEPEMP